MGIDPAEFEVDDTAIADAYEVVDEDIIEAMEHAAAGLASFHGSETRVDMEITEVSEGVMLGWRRVPIASVGVHVPNDVYAAPSAALIREGRRGARGGRLYRAGAGRHG